MYEKHPVCGTTSAEAAVSHVVTGCLKWREVEGKTQTFGIGILHKQLGRYFVFLANNNHDQPRNHIIQAEHFFSRRSTFTCILNYFEVVTYFQKTSNILPEGSVSDG